MTPPTDTSWWTTISDDDFERAAIIDILTENRQQDEVRHARYVIAARHSDAVAALYELRSALDAWEEWGADVVGALKAANTIGKRSCRDGDHLHYAAHDRLIAVGTEMHPILRLLAGRKDHQ